MNELSGRPIGVFDSGIGGLTVVRQVERLLPDESILYFGDTAHMPYGEKSEYAIQSYTVKTCHWFLEQGCKAILIACNSASATAAMLARAYVGKRALVLDVITPTVAHIAKAYPDRKVGLIATRATIGSKAYPKALAKYNPNVRLQALATPLLASMIEEGFIHGSVSRSVVEAYLSDPQLSGIEALILGCTHYPLIREQIVAYYQGVVDVIDMSEVVAAHLRQTLHALDLLRSPSEPEPATTAFYVSDLTSNFQASAERFLGRPAPLHQFALWE